MAKHQCPIMQHDWACIGACGGPYVDKCPDHYKETETHACTHKNAVIQEKTHERAPSFSCSDCGYGT